ncbi:MAG TPA: tripartite tricarboxylate transporter substrate binding protein [Xanthobacteraceae bacterium]|nr:tripartite tricarboxylate transporter substrate binding protein [Xanthobacteraceae bacterium]
MRAARSFLTIGFAAASLAAASVFTSQAGTAAEKYPTRPIHFIAAFPAGGAVDITARILADWLSNDLGQQVIVENRAGSGGNIGAAAVINSPPDGYTILFDAANNTISASLYKKLPYDFLRDTAPVAGLMLLTNIMVVPPSLPVKTVADFIALAKAKPGELSFASAGNGTSVHMSGELFKMMAGIDIIHVPYRGAAPAYPDLMTGKVHVLFDNLPGSIEFVRSGQLKALGVTVPQRWPGLPDIPAIAETITGFEAAPWYGISAPKGTPPEIVEILNKSIAGALANPKMRAKLAELGGIPMPMSPAEFGKFLADDTAKWAKVVKAANLSVE